MIMHVQRCIEEQRLRALLTLYLAVDRWSGKGEMEQRARVMSGIACDALSVGMRLLVLMSGIARRVLSV